MARLDDARREIADLRSKIQQRPTLTATGGNDKTLRIRQTAHGFVAGNVIRHNGTTWVKSQADTPANAHVQAMVARSLGADHFIAALPGAYVTGLSVTKGLNWTSAATAGLITATAPTHMRPCFYADSTSSGILLSDGPTYTVSTGDPGSTAATDGDLWFKYA